MENSPTPPSKAVRWTGYVLTALPALMMLFSAAMKFAQPPEVAKGFEHLGWPWNLCSNNRYLGLDP